GTGTVVFGSYYYSYNNDYNGLYVANSGTTLTIGSGVTVRGKLGCVGYSVIGGQGSSGGIVANQGTIQADMSGGTIYLQAAGGQNTSTLKASNGGTLLASNGGTLSVNGLTNSGTVNAITGGTVTVNGDLVVTGSGIIQGQASGTISVKGSLLGDTQNADLYAARSAIMFNGSGTTASPQLLEVMGGDLGAVPDGFQHNFAYDNLTLANNTRIQLVDQSDNAAGAGAEALYVKSLVVPAGTTLDLDGLHLYTYAAQVSGTIIGGTFTLIGAGGSIPLDSTYPGDIISTGQGDQWTFFGRAGRLVTVAVDPGGSGASPAPISPYLSYGRVQLVDPTGAVLGTAEGTTAGQIVQLTGITLPVDGTYVVRMQAASGHSTSKGNYLLTLWDATADQYTLPLNQQRSGAIDTAYNTDKWAFSAAANTPVWFDLVSRAGPGVQFDLLDPDGIPVSGFVNLTGSSDLITLPKSGAYTLIAHGIGAGYGGTYAFEMVQTSQTALVLGSPYTGQFVGSGQPQLFRVSDPVSNPLSVVLSDATTADHTEVYVRFGSPPTRQTYDYAANGAGASHNLLVPSANAGTWYVLVYGASIPSAPDSFSLEVDSSEVVPTGASNFSGSPSAGAAFTLSGAGFTAGSTVSLVATNGMAYQATTNNTDASTQLTATFGPSLVPAGTYTIRVTQPDGFSVEYPKPFTMTQSAQGVLTTSIEVPNPVGWHMASTLYVDFANTGNAPMPAPLLMLTATQNQGLQGAYLTLDSSLQTSGFWTSATPAGYAHSVQILASGATPGILEPGESMRVPVYYGGWTTSQWMHPPITFSLTSTQANDATPVDWASMKNSLQPAGVSNMAWDAVYANLLTQMGVSGSVSQYLMPFVGVVLRQLGGAPVAAGTAGQYVQLLDNEAAYLGSLGETVTDVSKLWSFAVQQASNSLGPLSPCLASATDDSLATPGSLSLSFSRVFAESIIGRNTIGPLDLGWSTPWQTTAHVASDGTVTVTEAAGGQRIFQPDSRTGGATYFSQTGDTGRLTADGSGGYLLTEADGTATDYSHNGALNYIRDTDGNRITAGYASGRLTSLTASSGQSLAIGYNVAGAIATVSDSQGRVTTYTYDIFNQNLISVTGFDGQTTGYTYDTTSAAPARNALTSIAFPGGTHQYFTYDGQGRLIGTSGDGGAEPLSFTYALGEVSVTDGTGATSQLYYNENGQLAKTVDALGNPTYYTHDGSFNLTKITTALGQSATYAYNAAGEVTAATDFLGNTTTFAYSGPFNELAAMTDANGHTTRYAYNSAGDLLRTTYANNTSETFTYDPEGDALSFVNANGQPISYAYNAAGQVASATFSGGTSYAYTYDSYGNLLTATDATGITTCTYDPATELLTNVAYPNGTALAFTYNAAGQRTRMVDQSGFTTNYLYDSYGRLSELTDGGGNLIVSYAYDADGRLSGKTNGNGTYTTYQYDANGNVLHLINYAPGGTVNSQFDYTYNALGLETGEATLDGAWTYTYDADGQLIHAVFASTNTTNIPNQDLTYNYDALGNRTSTVINGVTTAYTANNVNEYTSVGGTPYAYDADGNLLSDGTNAYSYNAMNELVGVAGSGGTTTYTYNALGQRVASATGGQTTQYLIDPAGLGNVVGTYTGAGNLMADYTYGLGLTSQVTTSGNYYYDFDAIGSTGELTNGFGGILNGYAYAPFGTVIHQAGTVPNPFQFVGQYGVMAEGNGLDFMRARFYETTEGRFTQHDPLGLLGGMNFYDYCGSNPVGLVDPAGLLSKGWHTPSSLTDPVAEGAGEAAGNIFDVAHEFWKPIEDLNEMSALWNAFYEFARRTPEGKVVDAHVLIDKLTGEVSINSDGWIFSSGRYEYFRQTMTGIGPWGSAQQMIDGLNPRVFQTPDISAGSNAGNTIRQPVSSRDPNAMYGPGGYGSSNFVQGSATLAYSVDFENDPTATAPAQQVVVADQLDPNLDWTTLQFTAVGFGDNNLSIPADSQHFETTMAMTYNGQTFDVDIELGLTTGTGQVFARFQSIDPTTGLPPNVLTGFLPPEDGTGRGMGYFSYTVKPKAGLPTGAETHSVALISFDGQPQIATDQVDPENPAAGTDPAKECLNTIDSGRPTSGVAPLPATTGQYSFTMNWSGQDDAGGSGIASYDICVSDNGGGFTPWLSNQPATATSETFPGVLGHTYAFYSVATDNVGNAETKTTPDTQVTVID
ncbi:MAG: RHS repeat-associated core domain-containing protein, partial [Tepidisphaeraceae bacterium]